MKQGSARVRERFLLPRLLADELQLYASVLGAEPNHGREGQASGATDERDPVCGMRIQSASARHLAYDRHDYYFCSRTCEDEFARDPERFLRAAHTLPQVTRAAHWLRRFRPQSR